MALVLMVLAPFPLGFLLKSRVWAYLAYIALHAFVFTFQTLTLIIEWVGGSEAAFGPYPDASTEQLWGYGAMNLLIYLVGLGLVVLGHRVRTWRRRGRSGAVNLDPVH